VIVSRRDGRAGQDVLRKVGEASVLILISLADGPKHGYVLIQDIKEIAGVELGPGTLYGALDRLERLGLIESLPADERRHPYRITAPGAAALRVHLESLERVSAAGRLRLQLGGILWTAPGRPGWSLSRCGATPPAGGGGTGRRPPSWPCCSSGTGHRRARLPGVSWQALRGSGLRRVPAGA
jgi:DNA-binding PadR family transcriptional regulator